MIMVIFTLFCDIESLGAIGVIVSASEEFSKDRVVSWMESFGNLKEQDMQRLTASLPPLAWYASQKDSTEEPG